MNLNLNILLLIRVVLIIILLIVMSKQNLFSRNNGLYKKITLIVMLVICGYCLLNLYPLLSKIDRFMLIFINQFAGLFLIYLVAIEIVGLNKKKSEDKISDDDYKLDSIDNRAYETRSEKHSSNLRDVIYNLYVEDCTKILKSPSSARFCSKDDLVITKQNGSYTVSGWVDSQNSYGAMIRTKLSIKIVYEDGMFFIKSHASKSAAKSFLGNMAARYIFAIIITIITFAFFYFLISMSIF